MAMFKCKMCGGSLEVIDGMTVCECEYCGTSQTVPTLDNEKKQNLFNRAHRLRFNNEFDKAASVFENIVAEFPEEPEAYWGLCLCKYGIEYVDDPVTAKKIPTCHRTSMESIFDDSNFEMALEYADVVSQKIYREEAKEIDRIQKKILEIVHNEKPYDIFICYKETGEDGQRTKDSVMAQDIYDALTEKGYKVFFARITLEDKIGQEYEPYIFAALTSAKIMLSIGTSYEHFNAVWVKNEWSRFLDMMKSDRSKMLIPCYCDIDAYDIPAEFRNLQGQDMNKIGFIQDLIRGIGKVIIKEQPVSAQVIQQVVAPSTNVENLLKRGRLSLEDEIWDEADDFFEQVLNENVEEPRAYLGKLMAEFKIKKEDDFPKAKLYAYSRNYKKMIKFAGDNLKSMFKRLNKMWLYNYADELIESGEKNKLMAAKAIYLYFNDETNADRCTDLKEKELNTLKREIDDLKQEYDKLNRQQMKLESEIASYQSVSAIELNSPCFAEYNEKKKQLQIIKDEVSKISENISECDMQIGKLGIFKKKEKASLQEERNKLILKLKEENGKADVVQVEVNSLQDIISKIQSDADKKAEEERRIRFSSHYEKIKELQQQKYEINKKIDELSLKCSNITVSDSDLKTEKFSAQNNEQDLNGDESDESLAEKMFDYETLELKEDSHSYKTFCQLYAWINTNSPFDEYIDAFRAFAREETKIALEDINTSVWEMGKIRINEYLYAGEKLIVYKDDGIFSCGKEGIFLTDKRMFVIKKKSVYFLSYEELKVIVFDLMSGIILNEKDELSLTTVNCTDEQLGVFIAFICMMLNRITSNNKKIILKNWSAT